MQNTDEKKEKTQGKTLSVNQRYHLEMGHAQCLERNYFTKFI
jgi:hypothetical protein